MLFRSAGKIVEVKMEVERLEREKGFRREKGTKGKKGKRGSEVEADARTRGESSAPPEQSEQPEQGTSTANATATGVVQQGGDSSTSVFSVPVSNHENLVFMEPLLGQLTSTFEQHLAQVCSCLRPVCRSVALTPGIRTGR